MNNLFYTPQQLKIFAKDLHETFVKHGFEIVEDPYVDYALCGFRAIYIRRYLLQKPTPFYHGILTTLIHVVGLPFGRQSQKMVILSAPRNLKNEPISETLKLRVQFDDNDYSQAEQQFAEDLANYVSHITEAISPGLIQLPPEMKLEILKKLSVDSIIRISQVNNEFRSIIFHHGESLWRHLCLRDFNIRIINRMLHKSWMELYRDLYIAHQVEICRKERALPGLPERPALPPVPYRLQIEWLPEVLELPFYPLNNVEDPENNQLQLALELIPLRRADSLDSIS